MHCERCNTSNEEGATFCGACGVALAGGVDSLGSADTFSGPEDTLSEYNSPPPPGPGTLDSQGRVISHGDADTLEDRTFMAEAGDAADLSTGDLELEAPGEAADSGVDEFGFTETLAERFELLEKLGEGGMGLVYKARDRRLRRLVALKRLTARTRESQRAIERFWSEATTVASLDHAGIIRIYNLIEDTRGICLELEFVGGGDLQSRLEREGALPLEEACGIVAQLCDAVSIAHEQGLVHRDIKPANVLLTPRGTPKLSDFGLARAAESGRTVTGALMGTLLYAAPEQLVSGKHVDARSDIYALGATLYALVTGEAPRTIRLERVPVAVRKAVGKCLEENPAKRYQTAQELKNALESAARRASQIAATACPACGSENPLDARFCQQCGGDLSSLFRTCPQCEKESRVDVEFCGGCGTHLTRHFAVQGLLTEARQLQDSHNPAEALRLCEEALELTPDHAEATSMATELRGVLTTIAERFDAAEKAEEMGRLEEAAGCFEDVLQLHPGHEGAAASLSRLRKVIAESERRAKAKQGRTLVAEMKQAQNQQDYEQAIEKCRAFLGLYPEHSQAEGHLDQLKQKRILQLAEEVRGAKRARDWDLVEVRCRAILDIEPENRETRQYLKRTVVPALLRKAAEVNDIGQARVLCARAEELVPDDAAILGRIEHLKGRISTEETRRQYKARQAVTAPKGQIETAVRLKAGETIQFVWIPPGEFLMGSPEGEAVRFIDEGPQHNVRITQGFWIGKYPVTRAQWKAMMGSNLFRFKDCFKINTGRNPVEQVSWNDCQDFLGKLNARRTGWRFRLPTEAEWEYACRAGTTTPFHFGETISTDQANYNGNYTYGGGRKGVYRKKTAPVGSFPANAWGLHDMHGNVWEWCEDDWHGNYNGAPTDGRAWVNSPRGSHRVLRGGSWRHYPEFCRSAYRDGRTPEDRYDRLGFRVVLSPVQLSP